MLHAANDTENAVKLRLLRGWSYSKLEKYPEALDCFNEALEDADDQLIQFAALLLKMLNEYKRRQHRAYMKHLNKLVTESCSLKILHKNLLQTVKVTCPYLIQEWPNIMKHIDHIRSDIPDAEGFKLFRSSSTIVFHIKNKELKK